MTFSIIARCRETGQSAPRLPHRPTGRGGPLHSRPPGALGLRPARTSRIPAWDHGARLDGRRRSPEQALETLQARPFIDYRQLMAIDAQRPPAVFTGASALGTLATAPTSTPLAAGNMLASREVPAVMLDAFKAAGGSLAERLMQALLAGQAAGGEEGPVHSSGLLVCGELDWPIIDLRMDWVDDGPVAALYAAWKIYEPQVQAYITRARDPRVAQVSACPAICNCFPIIEPEATRAAHAIVEDGDGYNARLGWST